MDDIGLCLADPPPQHLDVLVYLLTGDPHLLLPVTCHSDSQVLDSLDTLDAADFLNVFLREDLRLLFIEAEVPSLLQHRELVDDHRQLILVVRHYQHVISECQQVPSLPHVLQLLGRFQCLLQVHVE